MTAAPRAGPPAPGVRLLEVVAALSSAGDLTMGQPLEHGLRSAVLAGRLSRLLGHGGAEVGDVLATALLRWVGCTATAPHALRLLGDDIAGRAAVIVEPLEASPLPPVPESEWEAMSRDHCYVAQRLAARLGLRAGVVTAVGQVFERWDGAGQPAAVGGGDLHPAGRLAVLAGDVEVFARLAGPARALDVARHEAGRRYDPDAVAALADAVGPWLADLEEESAWDLLLGGAPPSPPVAPADLTGLLTALADFADLKVPSLAGHSRAVAELAGAAAARVLDAGDLDGEQLRRAGLVHDLGRTVVSNAVWERPGRLTRSQWETVRLHPYVTERCLARVPGLAAIARLASRHHERLDGSGYHRELPAVALAPAARVLAAADVAAALVADRPHRPARSSGEVVAHLQQEVRDGRLDGVGVEAVLAVLGERPTARAAAAGLSPRELTVLRLLAGGLTNTAVATRLGISPKTVSRHVEHVYGKLGVHSRAAAVYEALQLGLLTPGGLAGTDGRSSGTSRPLHA